MTWQVWFHRRGDEYPVFKWFHGQDAEQHARQTADALRGEGINPRLSRRVDGEWEDIDVPPVRRRARQPDPALIVTLEGGRPWQQ